MDIFAPLRRLPAAPQTVQCLRWYFSYHHDDWVPLLRLVEFARTSSVPFSPQWSLFYVQCGFLFCDHPPTVVTLQGFPEDSCEQLPRRLFFFFLWEQMQKAKAAHKHSTARCQQMLRTLFACLVYVLI